MEIESTLTDAYLSTNKAYIIISSIAQCSSLPTDRNLHNYYGHLYDPGVNPPVARWPWPAVFSTLAWLLSKTLIWCLTPLITSLKCRQHSKRMTCLVSNWSWSSATATMTKSSIFTISQIHFQQKLAIFSKNTKWWTTLHSDPSPYACQPLVIQSLEKMESCVR